MAERFTKLAFWGVRGSSPGGGRGTRRYGSNTSCFELEMPEGHRVILDCGTGLRALGQRWLKAFPDRPLKADVFLNHYHWDHVQGIPFFAPLYSNRNYFHFYGLRSAFLGSGSLHQMLAAQMAYPYFAVDVTALSARRDFTELSGGEVLEINGALVTTSSLNHPQGCLGFRFQTSEGTIVYATDNEPGVPEVDANLQRLAEGADILICDAQYTPQQVAGDRKGWGHSSWLDGVKLARAAGVRNLVLSHHDPSSTDSAVDEILRETRHEFASAWAAAEGMVFTLSNRRLEVSFRESLVSDRQQINLPAVVKGLTEDGRQFEEESAIQELSLEGVQLLLRHRPRLQSEVRLAIRKPTGESQSDQRIALNGVVIGCEAGPEPGLSAVLVLFT